MHSHSDEIKGRSIVRILLAPDKFKSSLTALEACRAMEAGIKAVDPGIEVIFHPLADGGEGSLDALAEVMDMDSLLQKTLDPLGRPIQTFYTFHKQAAYIEMAQASGLALLSSEERNPMKTSSKGSGLLLAAALEKKPQKVYLFVGGSATNDGGTGMAEALGYRFLDKKGKALQGRGENLIQIHRIVSPSEGQWREKVAFYVLTDVDNPLLGPEGASRVFALQKGASSKEITLLEDGMQNLHEVIRRDLGLDVAEIPGSGATGGLGGGGIAFLNAKLLPGAQTLMDLTGFDRALEKADLIMTGEGRLDRQTLHGKLVKQCADKALSRQKKLAIFCGENALSPKGSEEFGAIHISSLKKGEVDKEEAIREAKLLLQQEVETFLGKWMGNK